MLRTSDAPSCRRVLQDEDDHVLEAMLGFPLFTDGEERLGWLMNLNAARLSA